jgi:hypothetical protein
MNKLKVVKDDLLHESVIKYIEDNEVVIGEYEDMKKMVLGMIADGYMFNMERDRLRDAMEDITFMLNPNDDINKDRVSRGLEYDDEDSDEEEIDIMNEMKNIKQFMDVAETVQEKTENKDENNEEVVD